MLFNISTFHTFQITIIFMKHKQFKDIKLLREQFVRMIEANNNIISSSLNNNSSV